MRYKSTFIIIFIMFSSLIFSQLQIKVVDPKKNQIHYKEQTMKIKWLFSEDFPWVTAPSVTIDLFSEKYKKICHISARIVKNFKMRPSSGWGGGAIYEWKIQKLIPPGKYRIRVKESVMNLGFSEVFEIKRKIVFLRGKTQ